MFTVLNPMHAQFQYPLVMTNIAIENTPFIVDLPIRNGDVQQLC